MDEFPVRDEADAALESGRRRLTTIASVAAASVIMLGAIYFYAGRRPPVDSAATPTSAPVATDTDVAVEPTPIEEPGRASGAAEPAPAATVDRPAQPSAAAVMPPPQAPTTNAPPDAPAATRGTLVVSSTPTGALVTVDGLRAGLTPVTVADLEYGVHDVQVARPGFAPVSERVTLSDRSPSRTLTVSLAGGPAGAVAPGGLLEVDSRPRGAAVTVNGRPAGVTPLRLPGLPHGVYAVQLELGGYRTVRANVPVEPGQPARLAVTLEVVRR